MKTKTITINAETYKLLKQVANLDANLYNTSGDLREPQTLFSFGGWCGVHWQQVGLKQQVERFLSVCGREPRDPRGGSYVSNLRWGVFCGETALILLARQLLQASGEKVKELPDPMKTTTIQQFNTGEEWDTEPSTYIEEDQTYRDKIKEGAGELLNALGGLENDVFRLAATGNWDSCYVSWMDALENIRELIENGEIPSPPEDGTSLDARADGSEDNMTDEEIAEKRQQEKEDDGDTPNPHDI